MRSSWCQHKLRWLSFIGWEVGPWKNHPPKKKHSYRLYSWKMTNFNRRYPPKIQHRYQTWWVFEMHLLSNHISMLVLVGFFIVILVFGGVYQHRKKVSGLQLDTFTWRCTKISSAAKKNATFTGHYRTPTQPMHYWPPTQTLSKYSKALGSNMGGRTNNKHPWNHNGFTRKTPSRITIHLHPKWVPRSDPWPFYTLTWHFQSAVLRWRYSMIFNVCTDQEVSNHSRKSWSRI